MALSGYGFVKEVISGDTLVIVGEPRGAPPPELRLTLASLQAPRLALKPTTMSSTNITTKDQEAFAWESREFLRNLCIGKKVYFKVEYTVQSISRQFGALYLLERSETDLFVGSTSQKLTENICLTVAREGWCSVKVRDKNESEKSGDFDELVKLSEEAKKAGKGKFNTSEEKSSIRTVKWDFLSSKDGSGESEVMSFFNSVKEIPQRAVIEYIRDGSSMKALLLDCMTLVTFNLAGVQCPRTTHGKNTDPENDFQGFAQEAKFFTEVRLLNREVLLKIGGVNEKFTTFFGTVVHPKKDLNISVELVKNGLAHPADWSMSFASSSTAVSIHQAVSFARKSRIRCWQKYVPPVIEGDKSYSGVVAEVISGDSLLVRVGSDEDLLLQPWLCEERKIQLSSIRAPRLNRSEGDEPHAKAAKDFIRSRIVGKTVKVDVEYEVGAKGQERKYGTVALLSKNPVNIAALLLENGLATLIGHRQGSERSQFYHDLISAEEKGKVEKKGIWDTKTKKEADPKPVELNSPALAKSYLQNLKGESYEKKLTGIVEYVFNGGRVKLHVPSLNVNLVFNLSGIQCARTGSRKNKDEENMFGEQALAFTKALTLQKEVEFIVESVDKGGNFIGTLYVKFTSSAKPTVKAPSTSNFQNGSYAAKFAGGPGKSLQIGEKNKKTKENLSVLLLRFGLGRTNPIGIRFAKYADELTKEEQEAREAKVGLWLTYVEPVIEEAESKVEPEVVQSATKELTSIKVSVCHINDANNFFVHLEKEKTKLAEIEKKMEAYGSEFGTAAQTEVDEPIKKNDQVICLFDDGTKLKWYRAQIMQLKKEDEGLKYLVRYLDFGNEEEVTRAKIKKIDNSDIISVPPLAKETNLAFVEAPKLDQDFGREAALYLSQLTRGKQVQGMVHSSEKAKLVLTLLPAGKSKVDAENDETESITDNMVTINGLLLREGLAVVPKKVRPYLRGSLADRERKIMEMLNQDQEYAHTNHVNMWAYGDPREDDDDMR